MEMISFSPAPVSRYFVVFFLFLFFSPAAFADDWSGDCEADLPASFPDEMDWGLAYILKDQEDNSAWQRAILTEPTDSITIEEFESYEITGTAGANAPVQLYLYEPQSNNNGEGMKKPSQGVCLRETADENGYFVFEVTTRTLWGNAGKDLVIDPYYRMEKSWDQAADEETSQNFYIGTNLPLRTIHVEFPVVSNDSTPQMGCQFFGPLALAIDIDPADIDSSWKWNDIESLFQTLDDEVVRIARVTNMHTFYAGTKKKNDDDTSYYPANDLLEVSLRTVVMETIKRYLLGNSNIASSITQALPEISIVQLDEFATENKTGNIADMVKDIEEALTNGSNRDVALERIQQKVIAERESRCSNCGTVYPREPLIDNIDFWKDSFPANSNANSWEGDFLNLLKFWTGELTQNNALVQDDSFFGWNYLSRDWGGIGTSGYYSQLECDSWKMVYTQGVSPRLLLNTLEPITLTPLFTDLILHSSNKNFDENEHWNFPEGEKEELFYEYRPTRPLEAEPVAHLCVNQNTISQLQSDLADTFGLSEKERSLIQEELTGNILPEGATEFLPFSLANPTDIAKRIAWNGNGNPLNIAQLFFQREPGTCSTYEFTPMTSLSPFDSNREGFEVGMVE